MITQLPDINDTTHGRFKLPAILALIDCADDIAGMHGIPVHVSRGSVYRATLRPWHAQQLLQKVHRACKHSNECRVFAYSGTKLVAWADRHIIETHPQPNPLAWVHLT